MNVMLDSFFDNWLEITSGTGATSVSGDIMTAGADLGDQGYRYLSIVPLPGEEYVFSCEGRVTSNNGSDPIPGMFVDYPTIPAAVNRRYFDNSGQWRRYDIKFVIPLNTAPGDRAYFGLGSWGSVGGTIEVREPRLHAINTTPVSRNIWGLLNCTVSSVGALTIHERYNISAASWVSGAGVADSVLNITCRGINTGAKHQPRPIASITSNAPDEYIVKSAPNITGGVAGTFATKVYDVTTGAAIQANPSADTQFVVEILY